MIYICSVCGYVYDEQKEGKPISEIDQCPICKVDREFFKPDESKIYVKNSVPETTAPEAGSLDYANELSRKDEAERCMSDIHLMSVKGTSIIEAMGIRNVRPSWDDILIMGAQLNPFPLDEHADVSMQTVIGKHAKKPMVIDTPILISHMSFGALSKEVKEALAIGSAMIKTATSSGEGGILPEEKKAAYKYIFEYVPNLYSVTKENLKNVDAIEIKIGQGTKPGMGGHLPGEKVTEEIAKIRNKPVGKDIMSPSTFPGIDTKENLKELVNYLRETSDGRPIGIKIAAGKIEKDLEYVVYANPDFVTIDGRGGATGASPKIVRDSTSVPTIYALHRARKYLDSVGSNIEIIITGGLRISSDFAKAIAMGADAVAIGSAALIAAACQQYRICNSGKCPVGVATQSPELRKRLKISTASQRVYNFLNVSTEELKTFARITGHNNIHDLSIEDICTINTEISSNTEIQHA